MSFNGAEKFFKEQLESDKLRDDYYFRHVAEERLRKKSPTLQNAWEQYQIVLQLVKEQIKEDVNDGFK